MSRCARNSKPPLIASETTAIAAPRTVHPGCCVHLSPIGQPTSHNPAAIRYAQAIATSRARSRCDSRDHSEGRFQIRDSETPVSGHARVAAPVARGSAAPPAILPRHAQVVGSLAKNNPKARGAATAIDSYTCRLLELLTRPTRGPWARILAISAFTRGERAAFCCALLRLVDHFSSGRRQRT